MQETQDVLKFTLNFIITGGYLAVGLILFAIAYFIRRSYRTASYVCSAGGLTLLLAYAGFDIISRYFPAALISFKNIYGIIVDANQSEPVRVETGNDLIPRPYIRTDYDSNSNDKLKHFFISAWHEDYSCLTLSVGGPKPESVFFSIPVNKDDAAERHQIVIRLLHDGEGKLSGASIRHYAGTGTQPVESHPADLEKLPLSVNRCENAPSEHRAGLPTIFGRAWAGGPARRTFPDIMDPKVATELLKSDDPFIRRHARDELAEQGVGALPVIQQLIQTNDYQLQLGSLVALGKLPDPIRAGAPPDVLDAARKLSQYPDPTMQEAATYALRQ